MILRIVPGVLGLFFFVQGINWVANASGAAEALGMTLLDGVGWSTQVGDIGGFFFALGTMLLLGALRADAQWLRGGALLLGCAAITRTLAWLVQDAALALDFIGVEIVCAGIALWVASRFESLAEGAA